MAEEKEILLKIAVDRAQAQKELEATTQQLIENKKALNDLNSAFKQGKVSTDQYVRESISLKKSQKELSEQQRQLTKEISLESNSLDALRSKLSSLTKERNSTNQGTKEGAERFKALQKEILNTTTAIKSQEEAGGDFRRSVGNYASALKETEKLLRINIQSQTALRNEFKNGKITVEEYRNGINKLSSDNKSLSDDLKLIKEDTGNLSQSVDGIGKSFKESVGGVEVFGVSLDGLFKVMVANPVILVVTALVGLLNMLKQNDTIATTFKGAMTGLNIAFDQISATVSGVVTSFDGFGETSSELSNTLKDVGTRILNNLLAPFNFFLDLIPAVKKALKGDFSGAADIAGKATVQFGKSMAFANNEVPKFVGAISEAVKVGLEYEAALDAIESKQSKLNVSIAELTNQRDKLILSSKDLSKTEEERIALNEKAVAIDKRILNERLSLLNEEINAQEKYITALGKDSTKKEEAEFKLNDLQVKRLEFQNESLRFEEIAQNKRNAILEKQLANEAKLKDEEEKNRLKKEKEQEELIDRTIASETKLEQFRLDQAAKNAQSIDERLTRELEAEDFRVQKLLENDSLLASERLFIIEDSEAKKYQIIKSSEEKIRDEARKTAALKAQTENQYLDVAEGVANTLSGIAKKGSEEQKLLATAASLINTYQGVTGALANSAPPPVGLGPIGSIVAAASIGATGLANVAKINAAAGGGDFMTTKPTLLLVGDNPGGRERVTVEPLSGRGKTKVFKNSGLVAMAGGGSITTGASLTKGMSNPISSDVSSASSLITAFQNMPAPVVSVKEVTKKTDRVRVKESIKNL